MSSNDQRKGSAVVAVAKTADQPRPPPHSPQTKQTT